MSLHLGFEPHSWYYGFAIEKRTLEHFDTVHDWYAYTDDGNTYQIVKLHAPTLLELKKDIRYWHMSQQRRDLHNRYMLNEYTAAEYQQRMIALARKYGFEVQL